MLCRCELRKGFELVLSERISAFWKDITYLPCAILNILQFLEDQSKENLKSLGTTIAQKKLSLELLALLQSCGSHILCASQFLAAEYWYTWTTME